MPQAGWPMQEHLFSCNKKPAGGESPAGESN